MAQVRLSEFYHHVLDLCVLGELLYKARWPSGLRRQTKDLVRKGVGSNPTLIIPILSINAFLHPCRKPLNLL